MQGAKPWSPNFHTFRHLRPGQVYGRLWYRLYSPSVSDQSAPSLRSVISPWLPGPLKNLSMLTADRFVFLNEAGELSGPGSWNDAARGKLWLYNLHYFDDLNAVGAPKRMDWHRALIQRWVEENPRTAGNGWEPYPLSLRIVNWINCALRGNAMEPAWLDSLAMQVRYLRKRLEYHLLGNHLFANAKALVFAGLFFSGDEAEEWLGKGLPIILSLPKGEASGIIQQSGSGVVIPPEQPEKLAETVVRLFENRGELDALARASLAAASGYSRARQARNMLKILEQVAFG